MSWKQKIKKGKQKENKSRISKVKEIVIQPKKREREKENSSSHLIIPFLLNRRVSSGSLSK